MSVQHPKMKTNLEKQQKTLTTNKVAIEPVCCFCKSRINSTVNSNLNSTQINRHPKISKAVLS